MKNFLIDLKHFFKHEPIGTTWRLLVSPITGSLMLLSLLCFKLAKIIAYGDFREKF